VRRRRYPKGRRRRPGRPPPYRFGYKPGTGGYTAGGRGAVYQMFLPFRGREKRALFNTAAMWTALCIATLGASAGYKAAGALGGLVGAALGLSGASSFLVKGRYYR